MGYTIDIDTGGTFTDGFFMGGGRVHTVKVPTTPHDLTVCLMNSIKSGAESFQIGVEDLLAQTDVIRFSSTIGTNTLIERNGTKIGLLVSRGREEGLEVVNDEDDSPLVYPEMVRTLTGEVDEEGNEKEVLDREEVLRSAQELLDQGARCLVVCLGNSVYNPVHERRARSWIKEEYPRDYLGSVPVFLASDVSQLPGDQERINTAVVNAYIHARLVKFLYKAGEDLRKRFYSRPLLIVHATGGVARVSKTRAINTYNSGPAAGLMGVAALARLYNVPKLVSGDMGGTSFDMGIVMNGQPNFTLKPDVEGLALSTPMVAIKAIGAGGGSIASVRKGRLQVGPQSAGALPGPACFGLGGTNATVTDADIVLGCIDPAYYLGGKMQLDAQKAFEAIENRVASQTGKSVLEAALAIRDTVDATMGAQLKATAESIRPDLDPVLVIYGGAGSAHCCGLARHAGIRKIIAPRYASVFSACSLSSMDIWHIYSRRLGHWIKENGRMSTGSEISRVLEEMHAGASRDMRGEGFDESDVRYRVEFFLSSGDDTPEGRIRIRGLEWEAGMAETLQKQAPRFSEAESVFSPVVFLHATAAIPHYEITEQQPGARDPSPARMGAREVCWSEDGFIETPLYDRGKLMPGNVVEGPAIVEAVDTTYVVREGWTYTVDAYCNGIFEEATA